MKTDNTTITLFAALRKAGVKIDLHQLEELIHSHPQYPSLVCVTETLSHLGIRHHNIRLKQEELTLINNPFIAHLKAFGGQLVVVEQIKKSQVTFLVSPNNKKRMALHEFENIFSGAVVIIEPNQLNTKISKENYIKNKIIRALPLSLVILSFLALASYLFISHAGLHYPLSFWGYLLPITKLLGLTLTIMLVLHEFSIPFSLSEKICHLTPKTDCDSVLKSKAGKLIGPVGLADAGLIYFAATLTLLMARQFELLATLSILALAAPIYTVWAQVKLGKWCPLCMSVQVVLLAEFVILARLPNGISITPFEIILGLTTLSITATIWILYKLHYETKQRYKAQQKAFLALKRQPAVFTTLLSQKFVGDVQLPPNGFRFGEPNSPLSIAAFMSLQCPHCATEFAALKKLLDEIPQVEVKLAMAPPTSKEQQLMLSYLVAQYNQQGTRTALSLLEQWYANPVSVLKQQAKSACLVDDKTLNEWIMGSKTLFEQLKVSGTPYVLVNGFELPQTYSSYNLKHYITDILLLTQRRKGQEAQPATHS